MTNSSSERKKLQRRIAVWTCVAVILVLAGLGSATWYAYWYLWPSYRAAFPPDSEEMARFGSFLQGAAGSVFALASVLFIYVAFLGQRVQILLQQDELEMTNDDVAEQRLRLDQQVYLSRKQLFESSFFHLLAAHSRILEGITIPIGGGKEEVGRDCFTRWYGQFRKDVFPKAQLEDPGSDSEVIERAFDRFYAFWRTDLGHYFRSLYNLTKFVKSADLPNPKFYTNLVRAQMSDQEVLILFYNCLTTRGAKFRPLVEEYALLKHLEPSDLCRPEHAEMYGKSAFGLQ
ncbi:MAG: putative phage abortive infection protein [Chthoniobacterales bacterium]